MQIKVICMETGKWFITTVSINENINKIYNKCVIEKVYQ
jgi:hypothetical protein